MHDTNITHGYRMFHGAASLLLAALVNVVFLKNRSS